MSMRTPSPALAPLAWGALALGSALPLILWQELSGAPAPLWLLLAQAGALLALLFAARRFPSLRQLEGFLLWLLALAVGWHLVLGGVFAVPAWDEWQRGVPWVVRGAVVQVLVFVPTLLLALFGVGRRGRRELRLAWDDGGAIASPDPYTLWRRPAWRRLGPLWAVLISVGTLTAMLFAIPPEAGMLSRLLPVLPIVLLLAATNTFNEEFQFRNVPLATLPALLGKAQALLLTAVYFGLEHYYGNPPALSGVLLATFLGYLLGKSMLETGGSRWAWLIHWLQDVIIFSFLVMGWSS
jgi:membrane protease YdiL (CAAX protease family)